MSIYESPHRRMNVLTGEWVKVSPQRTMRPWNGQVDKPAAAELPPRDPGCYLCPGNVRANGERNPDYRGTYVFDNDFMAILPDTPEHSVDEGLLKAESEKGICRVICFSPRHDLTLALMTQREAEAVVEVWTDQYLELGRLDYINHVQIFENRGSVMGCSNPHPHGQIWAEKSIPHLAAVELGRQADFLNTEGDCLLCSYLRQELASGERIVFCNDSFAVLVPFWAVWPYETMVLPIRHVSSLAQLSLKEKSDLADAVRRLGIRYDNIFNTSFPYSMGIHQSPTDGGSYDGCHMHFHYYPPLLRSAEIRKFMVGYEMLGMPQRDITPEAAAGILRGMSEIHYKGRPE